jgi:hypothetical protein
MPAFTIETTYHVPFYRLRAYEADAAEQACGLAVGDDDWDDQILKILAMWRISRPPICRAGSLRPR